MIRVGIDTGGTFTDFVFLGPSGIWIHKVLSTPHDPVQAIVRGLSALAPVTIGALAKGYGLALAFYLSAGFFLFSAVTAFALPETKGRPLE
jgi:hypothetical protein